MDGLGFTEETMRFRIAESSFLGRLYDEGSDEGSRVLYN